MPLPTINLEQWAAFCAVVEQGSFAAAAEHLNKSQSSVSYTLNTMQQRLPAPALKMVGRKAELTELGQMLYRQARALLEQACAIDKAAEVLAHGGQSEISIAVDALCPMQRLFQALAAFAECQPYVRLRLLETTLSGTDEALLEARADIALTPSVPPGFLSEPLWPVQMLPVVECKHELAQRQNLNEADLASQRQIVVRDSGRRREQTAGWQSSEQRLTVSHFASSVEAVKAGLGFAFLPKERIEAELESGELVALAMENPAERHISIRLVLADQSRAAPVVKQLAEILRSA
ncbi:LysR family transcriptional regulator [Agaribacterium haliotis]|uniref:LysR family transcriptional regulator n=1 Tax=Agaribacterium haliotis TaxID=2013869 RepID=UPI000BB54015|nr:LysR family transcriptional regulator [Agaribacterium haliotis]